MTWQVQQQVQPQQVLPPPQPLPYSYPHVHPSWRGWHPGAQEEPNGQPPPPQQQRSQQLLHPSPAQQPLQQQPPDVAGMRTPSCPTHMPQQQQEAGIGGDLRVHNPQLLVHDPQVVQLNPQIVQQTPQAALQKPRDPRLKHTEPPVDPQPNRQQQQQQQQQQQNQQQHSATGQQHEQEGEQEAQSQSPNGEGAKRPCPPTRLKISFKRAAAQVRERQHQQQQPQQQQQPRPGSLAELMAVPPAADETVQQTLTKVRLRLAEVQKRAADAVQRAENFLAARPPGEAARAAARKAASAGAAAAAAGDQPPAAAAGVGRAAAPVAKPTRAQRKAERKAAAAAATAAGVFRPAPGLRLQNGATEHREFDFLFAGGQQQQQQQQKQKPPQQQQEAQSKPPTPAAAVDKPDKIQLWPDTPQAKAMQYLHRHVSDINPFWASATADPAGVLASAALLAPFNTPHTVSNMSSCALTAVVRQHDLQQLSAGTAVLQLWCQKLDDSVAHRVHWPYANQQLLVNDTPVYPTMAKRLTRANNLQPHQADLPLDVTKQVLAAAATPAARLRAQVTLSVKLTAQLTVAPPAAGTTSSSSSSSCGLSGYVLGCRLVKPRSIQEVREMLTPPDSLQEAVRKLQEKLAGDEDVVAEATHVSLRCAACMIPIQTPANFGTGEGLVCFDLDSFLEMTQNSGKWQCPGTRNFHTWRQLQVSPYITAVLQALEQAGLRESVTDIDVAPDAKWRPKGARSDCWFDVLQPPAPQELQDSMQSAANNALGGKRAYGSSSDGCLSDASEDAAAAAAADLGRPAKRQKHEVDVIDLAGTDSDNEEPQQQQQQQQQTQQQQQQPQPQQLDHPIMLGGTAQQRQQQQLRPQLDHPTMLGGTAQLQQQQRPHLFDNPILLGGAAQQRQQPQAPQLQQQQAGEGARGMWTKAGMPSRMPPGLAAYTSAGAAAAGAVPGSGPGGYRGQQPHRGDSRVPVNAGQQQQQQQPPLHHLQYPWQLGEPASNDLYDLLGIEPGFGEASSRPVGTANTAAAAAAGAMGAQQIVNGVFAGQPQWSKECMVGLQQQQQQGRLPGAADRDKSAVALHDLWRNEPSTDSDMDLGSDSSKEIGAAAADVSLEGNEKSRLAVAAAHAATAALAAKEQQQQQQQRQQDRRPGTMLAPQWRQTPILRDFTRPFGQANASKEVEVIELLSDSD